MAILTFLATEWLKCGTKWYLGAFYRFQSYGKRLLVPKNIGIDTNLALVNICQFYNFWPRLKSGTKWQLNAFSGLKITGNDFWC